MPKICVGTVSTPADATLAGQAAARAEALLREGDEYAAAGRLDLALERYDRADVIRPGNAETTLRIASTLDKQLRPMEAALQYRLFLHRLELEQIEARGEERQESDVDFLVDLPAGYDLFKQRLPLAERLSELVGRQVDLVPEHELNRHMREHILNEAVDL